MESGKQNKMKVEIWSDVVCPFCYIGKRKFEKALNSFPEKDALVIEWHSFQLNPSQVHQPGKDLYDQLAEMKGQTREWSLKMHESVKQMAQSVGLQYNFDIAQNTNTFDAHLVIQLAKKNHLDNEAEERFFKAYFIEGELISDHETLIRLAAEAGLDPERVRHTLENNDFTEEVKKDIDLARQIGVTGVPFFVFNRKYAVSGAQSPEVFLETLERSYGEWRTSNL
jgi:predicted DsbA family dithiol-disulfide isomerase